MTDDLPGPPLGALRAASANLMAAHLGASMHAAVKAAADHEQYLAWADTIGGDRQTAARVLAEVREELARTGHSPLSAPRIAYRRLLEPASGRPDARLRDVARQMLLLGGEDDGPESVDRLARGIAPMANAADQFTARTHDLVTHQGAAREVVEQIAAGILALAPETEPRPDGD